MPKPDKATKAAKGLQKKVGPLPLWAWALAAGAIVGGYFLFVRGKPGSNDGSPLELVSGSGGSGEPQDAAYGGYPSSNGAPGASLSPDVLNELVQGMGSIAAGNEEFNGRFSRLEDAIYTQTDYASQLFGLPDQIAKVIETTLGAPSSSAATATSPVTKSTSTTVKGIEWGGRRFTTRAALGSWLNARGASYDVWAQKHPEAAKRLTGPVPKPAVRPAPAARAPVRTAPAKRAAAVPTRKPAAQPKPRKVTPKPQRPKVRR